MFKKRTILTDAVAIIILFLILFLFIQLQSPRTARNPYLNTDIAVKIYQGDAGWGYDIYRNNVLFIHQPNIPALAGNQGFVSESDARKVAQVVADKIKKNILFPTITAEELKKIGIVSR